MKERDNLILLAFMGIWMTMNGTTLTAQNMTGGYGDNGISNSVSDSNDTEAKLQTLYNEEDDEDLFRMLQSEKFSFPSTITDGWYLSLHLGANNSWGSYDSHASWGKRTNVAAAFAIGKYITPVSNVRLMVGFNRGTGVRGRDANYVNPINEYAGRAFYTEAQRQNFRPTYAYFEKSSDLSNASIADVVDNWGIQQGVYEDDLADYHCYNWNSLSLSMAWLPNLTNVFLGYDPSRRYNVNALLGIDYEHTWGYTEDYLSKVSVWAEEAQTSTARNLVGLQIGLGFSYSINSSWQLSFEANETFLDDAYDGLVSNQNWDGHLNLLVGAIWYMKNNGYGNRVSNRDPLEDKYINFSERIFRNREAIDDALTQTDSVKHVKVTKDVTYTLVSFESGSIQVPRLQQNNVYQTAETYKAHAGSKIFITNSNRNDNKEFRQRAWSISKLLNQRWQIPLEDIWVDADEDHIQKLQLEDCQHYIIFIVND